MNKVPRPAAIAANVAAIAAKVAAIEASIQVVDFIKCTVRLKLLTCRFRKSANVIDLVRVWKLPSMLIHL